MTTEQTNPTRPRDLGLQSGQQSAPGASAPSSSAGALAADDPRLALAKAVALGGSVIAAVRPDQLDAKTPCDDFDVRELLSHLVAVLGRITVIGRRGDAAAAPRFVSGVADDGWHAAWTHAAHDVQAAWTDSSLLGDMLTLPFATLPGVVAVGIYTSEVLVHTWDLATATGQQPAWDDNVVGGALVLMRQALPAEQRGGEIPFDPVVTVPENAPLIEQLVAWTGRRV